MQVTSGIPPKRKWPALADRLRSDPRVWFKVEGINPASVRPFGSHIRNATLPAFRPRGSFEALTTNGELWARYVGPKTP